MFTQKLELLTEDLLKRIFLLDWTFIFQVFLEYLAGNT